MQLDVAQIIDETKNHESYEQYFYLLLFITLYKVVQTFKSVDETLVCDHSNDSYWALLSCGTVCCAVKVVVTFKFADETVVCDHSDESYPAVLSYGSRTRLF